MIAARFSVWWCALLFSVIGIGSTGAADSTPSTLRGLLQRSQKIVEVEFELSSSTNFLPRFREPIVGSAPTGGPPASLFRDLALANATVGLPLASPAMFWFEGDFSSLTHPLPAPSVLLHFEGDWYALTVLPGGAGCKVQFADPRFSMLWQGGTDMLGAAVRWLLKFPTSDLTHAPHIQWGDPERIGFVGRQAHAVIAVDMHRTGDLSLFIPSPAGDILLQRKPGDESFTTQKLESRSEHAVWVDVSGDGRLDLVSAQGQMVRIWRQHAPGQFRDNDPPLEKFRPIRNLAIWDDNKEGGIIVAEDSGPVTIRIVHDPTRTSTNHPSIPRLKPDADFITSAAVADFNGDSLPDFAQFRADGLAMWAGAGKGEFRRPFRAGLTPGGRGKPCVADFDADGRLDLLRPAGDGVHLWQNIGGGLFLEVQKWSGELSKLGGRYILSAHAGDLNNDGWHDLLLLATDGPPQLFYNRGFRTFAPAPGLPATKGLERLNEGQRGGLLTDIDNDGRQDLVLILTDGEVWLIRGIAPGEAAFSVRATLARDARWGPVLVRAASQGRFLGGWSVSSGADGAFFGFREPGPVVINWQFPGEPKRSQTVVLEENESRLWLFPSEAVPF